MIALLIWIIMAIRPDRFYRYDHVFFSQDNDNTNIIAQAKISVIIPARNEATALPYTLPSIVGQDYANLEVILVNDQSSDNTAEIALNIQNANKNRLQILEGKPLPQGWAGKLWALHQGILYATGEWILLTDADLIYTQPKMISQLLHIALTKNFNMISLMAQLQTKYFWEKLLIPAFLYFFKMLYPFSQVANPKSHISAAAGGCILIQRKTLSAVGGIQAIQNALIDDVALARVVKDHHFSLALLDSPELVSHRGYNNLSGIWKMVARSAFTELKYSYIRLLFCTLGLLLTFFVPLFAGLSFVCLPMMQDQYKYFILTLSFTGFTTLIIMAGTYLPTTKYFKLPLLWSVTLPWAGLLYLAMTLDSSRQYLFGVRAKWKDRQYSSSLPS